MAQRGRARARGATAAVSSREPSSTTTTSSGERSARRSRSSSARQSRRLVEGGNHQDAASLSAWLGGRAAIVRRTFCRKGAFCAQRIRTPAAASQFATNAVPIAPEWRGTVMRRGAVRIDSHSAPLERGRGGRRGAARVRAVRDPARTSPTTPIEVAITVDDLTRPAVPARAASPRAPCSRQLVDAFARHRLPPVTGFLNGASVEHTPRTKPRSSAGSRRATGSATTPTRTSIWRASTSPRSRRHRPQRGAAREARRAIAASRARLARVPLPVPAGGRDASAREAVRAHLSERGYRIARGDGRLRGLAVVPGVRALRGRGTRSERDLEALRADYRAAARDELLDADRARARAVRPAASARSCCCTPARSRPR